MESSVHRAVNRIACAAIVVAVLLNLHALRAQLRSAADPHQVARLEAVLQELRSTLPASGRVGYITDGSPTDVLGSGAATRRYYLTQYALAPLVVEPGTEHDLVIGHVEKFDPALVPANLFLMRRFGDELALYRKKAP
jgi:hypothetical protein